MYLIIGFFKESSFNSKKCFFSKELLNKIKKVFDNYSELNNAVIEGGIGFFKGIDNKDKNCHALEIINIIAKADSLSIDFNIGQELNITSEVMDKSIYRFAQQSAWINHDDKYYPLVLLLEKEEFDLIRKGEPKTRKQTSYSAQINEYFSGSNWGELCAMFEPLEDLANKTEVWTSCNDLYQIAFASSKLGEPINGLERDSRHLEVVKRYRELSLVLYKKCNEIEPGNYKYTSAIAYRHYLNISELSKPKGRRDGSIGRELKESIDWLDKTLELCPGSIKDNYRKGKLILGKQIDQFRENHKTWTRETFLELERLEKSGLECMERVIKEYEGLVSDKQVKYYRKEYVKTLYSLGCYYIEKPKNIWNEYICCKLVNKKYVSESLREDMTYIANAKSYFEKCFVVETNTSLEDDINIDEFVGNLKDWAESPMDKLYRLGLVYHEMYLIKNIISQKEDLKVILYSQRCEKYLSAAKKIGDECKKRNLSGRNTWFISEKLARHYIVRGSYEKAIKLLENTRDSFIKNTYAMALILSDIADKNGRAEKTLLEANNDKFNKAIDISIILLTYVYKLSKNESKYNELIQNINEKLNSNSNKLLTILIENEGE